MTLLVELWTYLHTVRGRTRFKQRRIRWKTNRWTRGCRDDREKGGWGDSSSKEASLLKPPNQHSSAGGTWGRKAVGFSYFIKTHCVTNGLEKSVVKYKFKSQSNQSNSVPRESCSPRSCDVCHHSKQNPNDQCFYPSEWPKIAPFTLLLTSDHAKTWLRVALQAESINTNLKDVHYLPTRHGR